MQSNIVALRVLNPSLRHLASRTPQSRNVTLPTILCGKKPEDAEGSATYVVSGHVVKGSGPGSLEVSGSTGWEGQAKLRAKDADKALKTLLDRDKEGIKAVIAAKEFTLKEDETKRKRRDNEECPQTEPSMKERTPEEPL
ncbi:hypothetical protein ARMGADRAFT_1008755 [Armillaria gallica]|uniref:Uncharacterized protein n=1 Tax=Armillaria gallica TaxID=47427 RepID=A0A2H3ECX3_ARMGA|nr:hypothetical protein ARMGADRAFT_1008755 [Armillaria gallica]